MIRINLLGVSKPVVRDEAGTSEGMAPEAMIIPGAIFVVLLLVSGFIWWYWTRDITRLQQEYVRQQNEQKRLAGIMEQNKLYEQRLNQLQLRINTIQTLQNSRVGPVELMRTLGSIADRANDLYLTAVTNKGDRLGVDGQANSVTAIANFVGSLQRSGTFDDVQLRQTFQDDQAKRFTFKFNLDCVFKPSAGGTPAMPAAQSGAKSPSAGRQAGL